MTGFASVRGRIAEREFVLEAKSVNHRFCEVNVRLPGKYSAWELPAQKNVREFFERGRIDIFIKEEGGVGLSKVDRSQFQSALRELKRLARELQLSDTISLETLLQFKQNYYRDDTHFDVGAEWKHLKPLLEKLLIKLARMRRQEGQQLAKWFRQRVPVMQDIVKKLKTRVKGQSQHQKKKLTRKLKELGFEATGIDNRVASEVALLAEKLDVTEEIVRLDTHLKAFRRLLTEGGVAGRKIDFLMQEVGREVNTIASKSQDSQIANLAVQFKTEVEKIREQAGNVE